MAVMGLSVVMLDYASQAAITPCESLVADMLQDSSGGVGTDDGYFVYSSMLRSVRFSWAIRMRSGNLADLSE